MNVKDLQAKIDKKIADIEKRKGITAKFEAKLAKLLESDLQDYIIKCDINMTTDDIKSSKRKLKELEEQLVTLNKQLEKAQAKDNVERIPVLEEFLEQWKAKTINWYHKNYDSYINYLQELATKRKLFQTWIKENNLNTYTKENRTKIKEKEIEIGIDDKTCKMIIALRFNIITTKMYDYRFDEKEREAFLEKEIEEDKVNKRALFIARVKEITGDITDVSFLKIAATGEINGIVKGSKGKAKVETISAGGYNIQCFHYRVLIRELD